MLNCIWRNPTLHGKTTPFGPHRLKRELLRFKLNSSMKTTLWSEETNLSKCLKQIPNLTQNSESSLGLHFSIPLLYENDKSLFKALRTVERESFSRDGKSVKRWSLKDSRV